MQPGQFSVNAGERWGGLHTFIMVAVFLFSIGFSETFPFVRASNPVICLSAFSQAQFAHEDSVHANAFWSRLSNGCRTGGLGCRRGAALAG